MQHKITLGQVNNTTNSNTTNAIDTFRAHGQISCLASDILVETADNSSENAIWVFSGDWEFSEGTGNLTNLVADRDMTPVEGTAAHKHAIEKINNGTGMSMGSVQRRI